MKMWSGRLRQRLDPAFESWQRSFGFDRRLLEYELKASDVYARALEAAGVLSSTELARLREGLETIARRAESSREFLEDAEVEDVHHFVEKRLIELIGELGKKLHSGRSRNEQIATDLRLYVLNAAAQARRGIAELVRALLDRAREAGVRAMPAYTHMQRAEPVLVAHWLLAYTEMLFRDGERLADAARRAQLSPLGSGAVAGSTVPVDRLWMARELGFLAPAANSMDTTSDRDFVLEFVHTLAILAVHLSRWAEEMLVFSTDAYGFLRLPQTYSTGSSAMPQKMNADLLELVRAKAGRIVGAGTALLITMKGLPLAYNKDLQETQEPLFEATEAVLSVLPLVAGWMRAVEFDFARMEAAAEEGSMNAFAAATYLVQKGVPFRQAHEQVGQLVRMARESRCRLEELDLGTLAELDPRFGADFYEFVKLANVLRLHDVEGGTHPARVEEALRAAERRLSTANAEAHAHA
jgi:argininosuccinate lyase